MSGPGSTPAVRGQLHALPAEREVPAGAGRRPGVEQPPGLLPHHPRHARALGQGAACQVAATRAPDTCHAPRAGPSPAPATQTRPPATSTASRTTPPWRSRSTREYTWCHVSPLRAALCTRCDMMPCREWTPEGKRCYICSSKCSDFSSVHDPSPRDLLDTLTCDR